MLTINLWFYRYDDSQKKNLTAFGWRLEASSTELLQSTQIRVPLQSTSLVKVVQAGIGLHSYATIGSSSLFHEEHLNLLLPYKSVHWKLFPLPPTILPGLDPNGIACQLFYL